MRRALIGVASSLAALAAAVALWQVQPNVAEANRGDAPEILGRSVLAESAAAPVADRAGARHRRRQGRQHLDRAASADAHQRRARRVQLRARDAASAGWRAAAPRGDRGLLPAGTLGDAVRRERPPAARMGRSGGSIGQVRRAAMRPLPVAEHRARHLCRPQHERLARRAGRRRGPEVHRGWQTSCSRSAGASPRCATATTRTAASTARRCSRSRLTWRWTRRRTSSTSPTGIRTSASSWSTPRPGCTSATGARTARTR